MADCWDEPTLEEKIAATKAQMERLRTAQELRKQGYAIEKQGSNESDRLIDLAMELKKLEQEKSNKEAEYWSERDI